jgi:hypothetical protein
LDFPVWNSIAEASQNLTDVSNSFIVY